MKSSGIAKHKSLISSLLIVIVICLVTIIDITSSHILSVEKDSSVVIKEWENKLPTVRGVGSQRQLKESSKRSERETSGKTKSEKNAKSSKSKNSDNDDGKEANVDKKKRKKNDESITKEKDSSSKKGDSKSKRQKKEDDEEEDSRSSKVNDKTSGKSSSSPTKPTSSSDGESKKNGKDHVKTKTLSISYYNNSSPLLHGETKKPMNILYIKVAKVASSTVGGIVRRVAHHHQIAGWDSNYVHDHGAKLVEPSVFANHGHMNKEEAVLEHMTLPYYLMTWVRDPVDRCLSAYYHFSLSRTSEETVHAKEAKTSNKEKQHLRRLETALSTVVDKGKIDYLKSPNCRNFQFNYIATNKVKGLLNPDIASGAVKAKRHKKDIDTTNSSSEATVSAEVMKQALEETVNTYHFIGSTTYFDDSALLLAWQLNLTMCDVLYLRSKDSQERRKDDATGHIMVPHPPLHNESMVVQDYAKSDVFRQANHLDYALMDRVHSRLDALRVKYAGDKEKFQLVLNRYKHYQKVAHDVCHPAVAVTGATDSSSSSTAEVVHKATANSVSEQELLHGNLKRLTKCYWNDNGCGYPCLDEVCVHHPQLNQPLPVLLAALLASTDTSATVPATQAPATATVA